MVLSPAPPAFAIASPDTPEHARTRARAIVTQAEAKAGLKAKLEAELSAAEDESELCCLRDKFSKEERDLEHKIGKKNPPKKTHIPHQRRRSHHHPHPFPTCFQITMFIPSPRR